MLLAAHLFREDGSRLEHELLQDALKSFIFPAQGLCCSVGRVLLLMILRLGLSHHGLLLLLHLILLVFNRSR